MVRNICSTTLFCITRSPFEPWKRTGRMLAEAKSHGYLTLVCLDDRSSDEDRERMRTLADKVIHWSSDGYCEKAYQFVGEVPTKFVMFVSDDELPSPALWMVGRKPPAEARWGIPVIPILGDRYDPKLIGHQERLSATKGWSWVGGFEGYSEGARQAIFDPNPGIIVWHYILEAPRKEREEKAARYQSIAPSAHNSHARRVLYEERPQDIVPLPDQLRRFLPNAVN